jgi:GT2 family glycosyltransferase
MMMTSKKYDIAVIMINYNANQYTKQCIESVIAKTDSALHYQIVVVDNASEKTDYLSLFQYIQEKKFSHVQLIRSTTNLGFGGGNMLGVHYSNAEYYAFVNNDSILLNDCLSIILKTMKSDSKYGICGPFAYTENGEMLPTLDHFASPAKEFFGRKLLEKINPNYYPNRTLKYTQPQKGQFIAGSFMVVKATDFNAVGGFDTNIFLYFEETDLCKRLLKIDKAAYLIPDAEFIHYHGASTPQNMIIKTELKISFLYVIQKHYGWFWHQVLLNKMRLQYALKSIFKPKYWYLCKVVWAGAPLSKSLKLKQKITSIE